MDIYNDVLNEGLSKVLYHRTNLSSAYYILRDNRFRLTLAAGSTAEKDKNGGKLYFMSFGRTMQSEYIRHISMGTVILKVDGDKLNNRYKGFPVDYWNTKQQLSYMRNDPQYTMFMRTFELEDRLVSDDQFVPNATKYIDEIYVLLTNDPDGMLRLRKLLLLSKKRGIKTYIFANEHSMITRNISDAVPFTDIDWSHAGTTDAPYQSKPRSFILIQPYLELEYAKSFNALSESARDLIRHIAWSMDFEYDADQIMHSLRYLNTEEDNIVGRLAKLIKKYGSGEKFLQHLVDKWKPMIPKAR